MSCKEEYSLDLDEVDHIRKIFQNLYSMRKLRKNCDLIINVEGKQIHANKDILCAASDYFNAMFSHDTTENESGIVEMQGVTYVALMKCIDFIYSGKLSTCEEECENLLYAARLLQLIDICEKIQPFLMSRLHCQSFFNMRKISETFSLNALTAHCDNFAISNLQSLADEEQFGQMNYQYISHLLSSSSATADSKLSIGLKWINHNSKERDVYLMKMVSLIDMEKVSRAYCRQLAESEPLCQRSGEFMTKVVLALTAPEKPIAVESENHSAADDLSPNTLMLFHEDTRRAYFLNDKLLRRQDLPLPVENSNFSTCFLDKALYVIPWNSTQIHALNTENWQWRQLSDSSHCYGTYLDCVGHVGKIYVGGANQLQRFDIALDRWQTIDLDSNICKSSSLVVWKKCLYIIGGMRKGFGSLVSSDAMVSCSLDSLHWNEEAQLRIARHNSSATVFNNKIYVAGGKDDLENILTNFDVYDGQTKIWTELQQMSNPRCDFRLLVVNQTLYAVGNGLEKSCIDIFDPIYGAWSSHPNRQFSDISIVAGATVSFHM